MISDNVIRYVLGVVLGIVVMGEIIAQPDKRDESVCVPTTTKLCTDIKFVMSQTESLQLDKLKLENEVLSLRKQLAEAQLSCTNASYHQELSNYTTETLKAHGNPDGVTLDLNTLSWKVQEKKQ